MAPLGWLLGLGVAVLPILLHYVYLRYKWRTLPSAGPVPFPIIGSAHLLHPVEAFHELLRQHSLIYGPVYTFWLGMKPYVVLGSPEVLKQVLDQDYMTFDREKDLNDIFHDIASGLVLQFNGDGHKRSRKLVGPAFHKSNLNLLMNRVANRAEILCEALGAHARSGEPVDVQDEFQRLTFDVIGQLCLGFDFGTQTNPDSPYAKAYDDCLRHLYQNRWLALFPIWKIWRTPAERKYFKQMELLQTTFRRIVVERRESGVRDDERDILACMLRESQKPEGQWVDDDEIIRQMMTFMFAGHDTTMNQMTWLFYYISQNSEVEARFHAELDQVLAGRTPTFQDLSQLTFLDKLMKETLRLKPSAPSLGREVTRDITIHHQGKDWFLPKGTKAAWSPYIVMHHPDNWSDPETFNPDREQWKVEEGKWPAPMTFVPFGAGPRSCIGEEMARKEIKMVAAMVGQRFRLQLVPGHQAEAEFATTLRARYGMRMTVHTRTISS